MHEKESGKPALLPEVASPRKMSTAWSAAAFEELAAAIEFIELGVDEITPLQRKIWERYKAQTAQFAHDMLLAEGDLSEIERRLGVDSTSPR
ncbi:hypothetical protein [Pseudomonas putida]|uniref:hypothetical protein n=1 Tax=Pseudomonas putida TaxID=303 RepID=UPI0009A1A08E|nr:hypothetical protein [Pseudomonas putida]